MVVTGFFVLCMLLHPRYGVFSVVNYGFTGTHYTSNMGHAFKAWDDSGAKVTSVLSDLVHSLCFSWNHQKQLSRTVTLYPPHVQFIPEWGITLTLG